MNSKIKLEIPVIHKKVLKAPKQNKTLILTKVDESTEEQSSLSQKNSLDDQTENHECVTHYQIRTLMEEHKVFTLDLFNKMQDFTSFDDSLNNIDGFEDGSLMIPLENESPKEKISKLLNWVRGFRIVLFKCILILTSVFFVVASLMVYATILSTDEGKMLTVYGKEFMEKSGNFIFIFAEKSIDTCSHYMNTLGEFLLHDGVDLVDSVLNYINDLVIDTQGTLACTYENAIFGECTRV
jgi:hypothetical protein